MSNGLASRTFSRKLLRARLRASCVCADSIVCYVHASRHPGFRREPSACAYASHETISSPQSRYKLIAYELFTGLRELDIIMRSGLGMPNRWACAQSQIYMPSILRPIVMAPDDGLRFDMNIGPAQTALAICRHRISEALLHACLP